LASVLLSILLAACAEVAPEARALAEVRRIDLAGDAGAPRLSAQLRLALSSTMEEALARGIPLVFEVEARTDDWGGRLLIRRRYEAQYLPLSRRYRLRDDQAGERIFARRAALIAALEQIDLPLPRSATQMYRLRFVLVLDALPAPLRLPARFDRTWHLHVEARWPPRAA
jgi:hypothetical protein